MYISHSQVELYNTCPYKYFLMKVEKWAPDKTYSALLFGSAIDGALNYILRRAKRKHIPHPDTAYKIFLKFMNVWHGQNEFVYFKNEAPETCPTTKRLFEDLEEQDKQWVVYNHLCTIGENIINTYITEVLPQLGTILSVQTKRIIPNEAGDKLVLITDFRARLPDGREITFDNKTSSDIKKYYGPYSVKESSQLAIYTEYESTKLAGYIALSKKLKDGKIDYKIVIDEIDEPSIEQAFDKVDASLRAINAKCFEKNEKACWSFGRKCEMWDLCKRGKTTGLIQVKKK